MPKTLPRALASIVTTLKNGGIGILPTDTLYGIVGSAFLPKTVAQIYRLRKRNSKKPMIILIGDIHELVRFGIVLDARTKNILKKLWPGKVSVILSQSSDRLARMKQFRYLHRGTKSLAFRLPKPKWLRGFLAATGPLVAPSANFEGMSPAQTVREAKKYFGDKVQFYVEMGRTASAPSTLVKLENGKLTILGRRAPNH